MAYIGNFREEDVMQYQVTSRREIVSLLRAMQEKGQLVTMSVRGGSETVVTSVLYVDERLDIVVIDRAPSATTNQRILDSDDVLFETVLDSIRVLFRTEQIHECLFEDRPALQIAIPATMIRLQRREHYRVATPVANPVRCTILIPPPEEEGGAPTTVVVALKNISGGGIGVIDEKKLLDTTIGTVYKNCKLDLPGQPITVNLQVRNSQDLSLPSGKSVRRMGFMFVNIAQPTLAVVQRYITKLERERNARATGMN
ncbi:flagellar brake protein [Oxalobacteraceae bacterium OM1]|nr:flagellar brake protein [Oxalobacteraceae bacterium OM1]